MPTFGYVYPLESGLAVIKYQTPKVTDPAAAVINFNVETWDYSTVRLSWTVPDSITAFVSSGTQLCITRSTFGYPLTTEDGVKVAFDIVSNLMGVYNNASDLSGSDVHRPPSRFASLYDNNLSAGFFYYYSLFFLVQGEWRRVSQQSALVPKEYKARDALYKRVPEYYRQLDDEFPGTTGNRDLYRYLTVVGFEMDIVRTLAEYVEHIYDSDFSPLPLMQAMGTQNLGVPLEGGLGDIRYRAVLANINRLYEERGTVLGLKKLVEAASKYPVITTNDINMMVLPDDSSFATGLGSWAIPFGTHAGDTTSITAKLVTPPWGTGVHATLITDLGALSTSTPFADITPQWMPVYTGALGLSKTGMLLTTRGATAGGTPQGVMVTCGYGTTFTTGRRSLDTVGLSTALTATTAVQANPYFNGIRCRPDIPYTFSFYAQRISALAPSTSPVSIGAGILWYSPPPSVSNNNLGEQLSASNLVGEDHYIVIPPPSGTVQLISAPVTNKALVSNVATLTSTGHPFNVGDYVTISGVDATFNGTFIVTVRTANTFSYAKTASDVASAAAAGTAVSGGDASLTRQRYAVTSISPSYRSIYAVPFIVLSRADGTSPNPVQRVISNCMFYIAQQSGIISPSVTPTPTPTSYYILGPMILGDESQFLGGDS